MASRSAADRSRRRFARRQWARRWLTGRYIVVAAALIALVGGAIYTVYFSSALAVQGVDVVGADTIGEETIEVAADVPTGGALATLDLVAIERRVASLAAVKSVDVSRQWPHDVRIEVEERAPVAVVQRGGQLRAVDASGAVFNSYRRAPAGLPLIEADIDADADALREAATVVAALPPTIAVLVDHLELVSVDEINLVLRDGREVRWGSAEASEQKSEVLVVLLVENAQVYDVSVPSQPTTSGGPTP